MTQSRKDHGKSTKMIQGEERVIPKRETYLLPMRVGGRAMNALVDPGSEECLVRKDLLKDSCDIRPAEFPAATLFDGTEVDILGCVDVPITNQDKRVEMRCYVVAELAYPLILGANWIRSSGVVLIQHVSIETVNVCGIGPVDALIDSGCESGCLIRRDLLTDSIMSKFEPKASMVTLFGGSKMRILGRINLEVCFLGKTVETPFLVAAELSNPIILGANWIRKSGVILQSDGKRLRVTLGGRKEEKAVLFLQGRQNYCSSPRISVDVDDIGEVNALVDTGATCSFIRRDLLSDIQKSEIIPHSAEATIGDGKQVKIEGLVSLNVTFQGIATRIENVFVVSGEKTTPFILGMDWIHQTRAVLQSDGLDIIVSQPGSPKMKKNGLIHWLPRQLWNSARDLVSGKKKTSKKANQKPK